MYTNRRAVEGFQPSLEYVDFALDDPALLEYSTNKDRSKRVLENVQIILAEVSLSCATEGLPLPVISGGCIRDIMQGVLPKDIDAFLHVPDVEEDDILSSEDLFEGLAWNISQFDNYARQNTVANKEYEKDLGDFFAIADYHKNGYVVQVIGKKDERLIDDNPLLATSDYPYNLVKNVMFDSKIRVSKDVLEGFEKKEVVWYNEKGEKKAKDWLTRNGLSIGQPAEKKNLWTEIWSDKYFRQQYEQDRALYQGRQGIPLEMPVGNMERLLEAARQQERRGAQIANPVAEQPHRPRGWQAGIVNDLQERQRQRNEAQRALLEHYRNRVPARNEG